MAYVLVQFTSPTWSVDPAVVSCAVERPDGVVTLYTWPTRPAMSRGGVGQYQIQVPLTVNATLARPYTAYWFGSGQAASTPQYFPGQGQVIFPVVTTLVPYLGAALLGVRTALPELTLPGSPLHLVPPPGVIPSTGPTLLGVSTARPELTLLEVH